MFLFTYKISSFIFFLFFLLSNMACFLLCMFCIFIPPFLFRCNVIIYDLYFVYQFFLCWFLHRLPFSVLCYNFRPVREALAMHIYEPFSSLSDIDPFLWQFTFSFHFPADNIACGGDRLRGNMRLGVEQLWKITYFAYINLYNQFSIQFDLRFLTCVWVCVCIKWISNIIFISIFNRSANFFDVVLLLLWLPPHCCRWWIFSIYTLTIRRNLFAARTWLVIPGK